MELSQEDQEKLFIRLIAIPEGFQLLVNHPSLFVKYAKLADAWAGLHNLSTESAFLIMVKIGAISDDGVPDAIILESLKDLAPGLE
jgi:hypothetical protein